MKYRWMLAPSQPLLTEPLRRALGVSPLLAQCLVNRGFQEPARAADFLEPRLRHLGDPAALPQMDAAVERLWQARERNEQVVVFGDYDVDGVTATALLLEVLRPLGWRVQYYLPHRLDEGYGLTKDAAENCVQKHQPALLVAVDCGSTARATIGWLRQRGVEVVVVDHHQVADPPPCPAALVNPQLGPAGADGARELCSVGLAFKLAHAVVKHARQRELPAALALDLRPLLDLVALGTLADLVPVLGENRILVTFGLERLNRLQRPGVLALRDVAQIHGPIGPYEVGFQLAPRLNAAGRLENATDALELLLARDAARAQELARSLELRNRERQSIERHIVEEVVGAVRSRFNPQTDYVIVEGQLLWHVGVVGIVASRVLQEFYRPTLILGGDGHVWRGSGRSIEGFDLAAALRACDDLLVRHGGHAMAAGVTVHPDRVSALRSRLNTLARQWLNPEQLRPLLRLDAKVLLTDLTLAGVRELERLQPGGQGNPPVQFMIPSLALARPPQRIGREQQHLKLWVTDGQAACETLWWGGGEKPWPTGRFDLACAPQVNEFNGHTVLQLKLLDWRPAVPDGG
jgi:single-stranded-DNA-specific exonuclease